MFVKGKTKSGFEYEIDSRVRKDRKTLKILKDILAGTSTERTVAVVALAPAILGEEQTDRMEEYFRSINDGYCNEDAFDNEVMGIFNGTFDYSDQESKEAKN